MEGEDSESQTTTDSSASPAARCHLFQLPAKLRDQIWELTLSDIAFPDAPRHDPEDMNPARGICMQLGFGVMRYHAQPPITRLCRQFRSETLAMVYEKCVFYIHVDPDVLAWDVGSDDFGPHGKHVSEMRHFEFRVRCKQDHLYALDISNSKPRTLTLTSSEYYRMGTRSTARRLEALQRGQDMLEKLDMERGEDMKLDVNDLLELFKVIREYRVEGGIGQEALPMRRWKVKKNRPKGDHAEDEDAGSEKEPNYSPIPPELVKWKKQNGVWTRVAQHDSHDAAAVTPG